MAQFRRGLRGRLGELLPSEVRVDGLGDVVLLDEQGLLTDEARDLAVEHLVPSAAFEEHWPWARVATEQEERRIYEVLRRLPQDEYARARELLVESPAGDLRKLRRTWDKLWGRIEPYEPIVEWSWCQLRGFWFPCPTCAWPMRVTVRGAIADIRCEAHARSGVSYTCSVDGSSDRAPVLHPAGHAAERVRGVHATTECRAVSRAVWRYVTLPGKLECELRDHARDAGAEVTMWPHKDRYDLKIKLRNKAWKVDAKAWVSPLALADALRDKEPPEPGLIIVIPDHQRSSAPMVAEAIRPAGYRLMTMNDIKVEIDKVAGRVR
ncbi:hypothetical protein [Micromonospora sp. NPDC047134]|uniref:restriction endonuclease-related protein n=1 Tax=Micromonospora sp. NPDC047134 TaxID=3154340 RepID=UPI0033ED1EBD